MTRKENRLVAALGFILISIGCLYLSFWLLSLEPVIWWVAPTFLLTGCSCFFSFLFGVGFIDLAFKDGVD